MVRHVTAAILAAMVLTPSDARADRPDVTIFAGATVAATGGFEARAEPVCSTCMVAPTPERDGSRVAMFALGLAGSEGRIRGGGELLTLLGLPCDADGFSAALTYAGVDRGNLFAQGGLGIGSYWGGVDVGLGTAAGIMHGELGYRLMPELVVMTRGDLLLGSSSGNVLFTIGVQLIPDARPRPPRKTRLPVLTGVPAL